MKKLLSLLVASLLAFGVVGCTPPSTLTEPAVSSEPVSSVQVADGESSQPTAPVDKTAEQSADIPESVKDKQLKFMLIYETGTGTYASQFISGFKGMCDRLGIEAIVSDAAGSQEKMLSYLDTAINQKVDGIVISHGRTDALAPGVKRALAEGIAVITKDVDLGIPEVPTVDQDDYMLGLLTVKAMCEDIGGSGNVARGYVGGFVPQERRSAMFQLLLERYTDVKEVATFGSVTQNSSLDAQNKMEAILKQYPNKGDLAAVWTGWEEWSKGAARAIMEAGRGEIKVYGIDISDETLQMLQDPANPYTASSGVDPAMSGEVCVRMALTKLGGGYVPRYYSFNPVLVKKSDLPAERTVTMAELKDFVPGWGVNNDFYSPWIKAMEK